MNSIANGNADWDFLTQVGGCFFGMTRLIWPWDPNEQLRNWNEMRQHETVGIITHVGDYVTICYSCSGFARGMKLGTIWNNMEALAKQGIVAITEIWPISGTCGWGETP